MGLANIRNRLDLYSGTIKISGNAAGGMHIVITMNGEIKRKLQRELVN